MLVFLRQNVGEKKSLTRLWALKAYPADLFSMVPQYQPAPPRCSARARSWIVWFSFFYHSLSFILSPLSPCPFVLSFRPLVGPFAPDFRFSRKNRRSAGSKAETAKARQGPINETILLVQEADAPPQNPKRACHRLRGHHIRVLFTEVRKLGLIKHLP